MKVETKSGYVIRVTAPNRAEPVLTPRLAASRKVKSAVILRRLRPSRYLGRAELPDASPG